jgi:hypothetical protein
MRLHQKIILKTYARNNYFKFNTWASRKTGTDGFGEGVSISLIIPFSFCIIFLRYNSWVLYPEE